ncbi:lysozyme inhibitor LprI family protein [Mesorhizobium sp. Z1-4]|uniref:lysozyme inhibitor LprI family protein n=1 Tax=Mesorhizobium sp. Z1-4 TaxID=2448478 RepID=UPI000FD6FCCC|nr:lysozyme inhibitor LprI family protein [Mesorhizobium sp. Z1-4]
MRLKIIAAILLAASTISAPAQNCEDPQTQLEMNHCAGLAYEAADAQLNEIYGEVRSRLDPDGTEQLVATQRAWIAYRDAECTFRSRGVEGGTIYATIHAGCLADLTEQRTADFETMLACPEGDLSCPF